MENKNNAAPREPEPLFAAAVRTYEAAKVARANLNRAERLGGPASIYRHELLVAVRELQVATARCSAVGLI